MPQTDPAPRITADDAAWLGPLLGFRPSVAARFERENGRQRVRQLRQAIFLGLVFFNVYGITATVVMPDVLGLALILRLALVTPVALLLAWSVGRLPEAWREGAVTLTILATTVVPITLMALSRAPFHAFAAGQTYLMMVYATMMLMLRFSHALVFISITVLMALPSYFLGSDLPRGPAAELVLQLFSAAFFSLYGSYRLERSVRLNYLSATQSWLRASELQVDNTTLERLSSVDPLTGVANRRRLAEWLALHDASPPAASQALAVIMVDVDHFKSYNDHYGHPAGDTCLQRIAVALMACVRDDRDLLARYGGEEFAILLPNAEPAEAARVADRLCTTVAALGLPHAHRGDGLQVVTVSAGVATLAPGRRASDPALFEAADAALYAAKRGGRNQHAVDGRATHPAGAAM